MIKKKSLCILLNLGKQHNTKINTFLQKISKIFCVSIIFINFVPFSQTKIMVQTE